MDSDKLASMYAQILLGVPKTESHYVIDEETGAAWDEVSQQVAEIKAAHPDAQFDIPGEMPKATEPKPSRAGRATGKP